MMCLTVCGLRQGRQALRCHIIRDSCASPSLLTPFPLPPISPHHRRFLDSCSGPTWLVDIPSGHMQFLDKQQALFSMFSASGPTPDATVRTISQVKVTGGECCMRCTEGR